MAVFKLVLRFIVIHFRSTVAVLPQYTPVINADGLTRDEIIKECFNLEMNYVVILSFLVNANGIQKAPEEVRLQEKRCNKYFRQYSAGYGKQT